MRINTSPFLKVQPVYKPSTQDYLKRREQSKPKPKTKRLRKMVRRPLNLPSGSPISYIYTTDGLITINKPHKPIVDVYC